VWCCVGGAGRVAVIIQSLSSHLSSSVWLIKVASPKPNQSGFDATFSHCNAKMAHVIYR